MTTRKIFLSSQHARQDDANLFWGVIEHFRHSDNNSLCIDIGACYGSYSTKYASLFENVVCFEANHYIEVSLRKKLAGIKHNNIEIHMNGLGKPEDHNTEKLFCAVSWSPIKDPKEYSCAHWRGISSYDRDYLRRFPNEDVHIKEIKTIIKTLDSYNLAPSFIKIDVEGAEVDVIMGAMKTILKYKPTLQVEEAEGSGSAELIKSLGYRLIAHRTCHGALTDRLYVHG